VFTRFDHSILENRFEQFERGIEFRQVSREYAGEIVAHIVVVRINQQRAFDRLHCQFAISENRMPACADTQRRAIAGILGSTFSACECIICAPLSTPSRFPCAW
jgi:hypothetical protein